MWDFYYAPGTISLASHIALLDAGVTFRLHRLDFTKSEHQKGEYAKLNPKLRVPALVTENGVITETPAILTFIAQSFPEANLAPTDPFEFAKLQELLSYIASTLHVSHAHRMRGYRWVDPNDTQSMDAMKAKVPQNMTDGFAYLAESYSFAPFVMGDTYSLADAYLYTVER